MAARVGLRMLDPYLRAFDRRAAASADTYLANSTFVRDQIRSAYGIDAEVLHPPSSLDPDGPAEPVPDIEPGFLLTVARLLPYKHVAETVDAFRLLPGHRLVVVGEGPGRAGLEASLPGNVRLLGDVSDARLRWLYANCAGLVTASREDFGLTPVEAAAFGKPVAALRFGGHLDTVRAGRQRRVLRSARASGDLGRGGDTRRTRLGHRARNTQSRSRRSGSSPASSAS